MIIRPFNTYGPRQSMRAIIPTVINQALYNPKFILLGNLNAVRDMTYINDTVMGFFNCIKYRNKIIGQTINLGSGYGVSIKHIADIIINILGVKSKIKIDKKRVRPDKSEVTKLISSNKKAKKLLNWNPTYSNKKLFNESLKKTINWYSKKKNLELMDVNSYII
jgi:dTDP-glucose 4,6-dehydratase